MAYKVGQVLYVVLQKQTTVYPMQIVEEITKKTLEGSVTDYVLQAGLKEEKIHLKDIQGEVFETPEQTKRVLVDRVVKQIERLVDQAVKKSQEWYPTQTTENHRPNPAQAPVVPTMSATDIPTLELPDGTTVRVKLPEILMND